MENQRENRRGILEVGKGILINVGIFLGVLIAIFMLLQAMGVSKEPIGQAEFESTNRNIETLERKINQLNYESVQLEKKKEITELETKKTKLGKDIETTKKGIETQKLKLN